MTTTALELQKKKKEAVLASITQAHNTFVKMYEGAEAEKKFEREKLYAMMAINKNPDILNCKPQSIYNAVASVAMADLSLDPVLGLCHLIPRGGLCTLAIDYKGIIELLLRTGKVKNLYAGAVYEGDDFDFMEGIKGFVKHKRKLNRDAKSELIAVYSHAVLEDGSDHVFILDRGEIEKRRKKATSQAVWNEWLQEMAIKTAIRAHYKYLPKTQSLNVAMEIIDSELGYDNKPKSSLPDGLIEEETVVEPTIIETETVEAKVVITESKTETK